MEKIKQPLVSIILITYNSSKYVLETLDSIKAQTWTNIELIISDDCSSDNSVSICRKWIAENSNYFVRTKIITVQKNTGTAINCNRGVRSSIGDWIKIIAGDDILLDSCIEDNLNFAKCNSNAQFIVSDVKEINDDGKLINDDDSKNRRMKEINFFFYSKTAKKQLKSYARWPVFLNSPTFFISKSLFERVNLFDEDYRIYDDMPLIYRVSSNNYKIYYMNKPTVRYRIHDNSISRKMSIEDNRKKEILDIFKKYRKPNLNIYNLIDLSIYYERWVTYYWEGFMGYKGRRLLYKISLFYWYVKYKELTNNYFFNEK